MTNTGARAEAHAPGHITLGSGEREPPFHKIIDPVIKRTEELLAEPAEVSPEGITVSSRYFVDGKETDLENFSDCQCQHCQSKRTNKSRNIINHGAYKSIGKLVNRVGLYWSNK
ncbi:hypothetical protein LCGC14_1586940 [marine sediment metagenome]|uniref:Uncharacterized protein n=1 Tax=marine sediment metagenome TaxID=412755 RepID=A0A0F9IF48_9ZZZZ